MKYVGARYVPKFMGTYDATQSYENMCVVDNGLGTSYISQKPVPAGTPLTDSSYWALYGASSGAIINLQNQIDTINNSLADILTRVDTIVTPEMFGAVGDGVEDDTNAINDMFAYALGLNNDAPYGIKCAVLFNGKQYRTTDTIEHDNAVKVILLGNTYIHSEVTNKPAWIIDSSLDHVGSTDPYEVQELYKKGNIFEGGGNLCIVATNAHSGNIGMQVGKDASNEIAISNICGLSIINFEIGLFINSVNTYILTFRDLYLEYNTINVKYGGVNYSNSSEKFVFENCTFGHAYRCVYIVQPISAMNFENCSFDFNTALFIMDFDGNGIVILNNCHIEGTGYWGSDLPQVISNDNGYYFYVLGNRPYSTYKFNVTNSYIHDSSPKNLAEYRIGAANSTKIVSYFLTNGYSLSNGRFKSVKALGDDNVYMSESYETELTNYTLMGSLRDPVGRMATIPGTLNNQDIYADQTLVSPYYVSGNTWSNWQYLASALTAGADVIFTRSLLVNIPYDYTSSGLARRKHKCKGNWIKVRAWVKSRNLSEVSGNYYRLYIACYDEADKNISSRDVYFDNNDWADDTWSEFCVTVPVEGIDHVNVSALLRNDGGVHGDLILGGLIIEDCI